MEPPSGSRSDAEPSQQIRFPGYDPTRTQPVPFYYPPSYTLQRPEPAGVPRRFGIGTLMVIVGLYGGLFGLLQVLEAPTWLFVMVVLFTTAVGLGQMLLFRGKDSRLASVLIGALAGGLLAAAGVVWDVAQSGMGMWDNRMWIPMLPVALIMGAMLGVPAGYVTGCLIAGVFFVMDSIGKGLRLASAGRQAHDHEGAE